MLVNFENIANIHIAGKRIYVVYFQGECADTIAEYSTEEKAIKVLDVIQSSYEEANSVCTMSGFVANTVFQMPQDSEV